MKTQNKRKCLTLRNIALSCMKVFTAVLMIISILGLPIATVNAENSYEFEVTNATDDFYVNDFAGVLTEQQKADMMKKAVALDKEYAGIQVVVTTVESFADCSADGKNHGAFDTSYAMYKQYGIGKDDMGILILFSVGDRDVYMQTGHEMQIYITDSKAGQLLDDYGMDYFRNNQFAEGLVSLQEATISEIKSRVPQDWNNPAPVKATKSEEQTKNNADKKSGGIGAWLYLILVAIVAMIIGLIVAIKSLFTAKSKAVAQKEKFYKELKDKETSYEQKIASARSSAEINAQQTIDAHTKTWERTLESKNANITSLEKEVSDLKQKLQETNERLKEYEDKYSRIEELYPNIDFDKEVHEMIENEFKASALAVDDKIARYVNLPADKDNVEVFSEAIRVYDTVVSDVQKYVTTDIPKLHSLYEESVSLRREYERAEKEKRDRTAAQKAFDSISLICCNISCGNHENYETLNRAYKVYTDLSSDEKKYFPNMNQIHALESLRRSAEADWKDFNEACNAEKEIHRIVDRIYTADEDDRDKLERAMRYYRNLSNSQQRYFSNELLRKLKHCIDDAESDHRRKEEERRRRREEEARRRRREEEERRRRMMNSRSSFSSGSHSSFGGHGGMPSGGGAGRHF